MRLASRIRGLERSAQRASAGRACAACGLARGPEYHGAAITADGPRVVRFITEIEAEAHAEPDPPCAGCGRVLVFRIPPPVPARQREAAA